ncbi:MAG TPA: PP2C family serine/threonine-protein phosphatase [Myxococcota bacterium]|nr:PP2C family serine/threonine-protein phosphatase [Myxococcota bacterium]
MPAQTASLSDVGRTRSINQDSCGEFQGPNGEGLLVLCDGMGGHHGGEIASQVGVEAIGAVVTAGNGPPDARLIRAFQEAHRRIRDRAREQEELRGMGTTGVALLYDGRGTAWVAHVGDSRAYRVRGGRIEQITQDHSVVADQLRRGVVTAEEAEGLPHNELLRAIGASPEIQVDVAQHDVRAGDRFLLCSDGLWNIVSDQEMVETVERELPSAAVRLLVARANDRGANDNVTVQILAAGVIPSAEDGSDWDSLWPLAAPAVEREAATSAADPEAIWTRTRSGNHSQRERQIRIAAAAAALLAIVLMGTLLWIHQSLETHAVASVPSTPPPPPSRLEERAR